MRDTSDEFTLDPMWRDAIALAERGDILGVICLLKSLADKGVLQVLAQIGALYESGSGNLEKNLVEAIKWYQKSVFECDDPLAHPGLGRIYCKGAGYVEQDRLKALHHFQKAYTNKLPQAGIYLGIMAYFGMVIEKNNFKAREYFQFAADSDYFLAYAYLARIEFALGHFISGIKITIKSWKLMVILTKKDPRDSRLLGVDQY